MPVRTHDPEDVALNLALALVTSSPAPLLLLDGELTIIAASPSFYETLGVHPEDMAGKPFLSSHAGARRRHAGGPRPFASDWTSPMRSPSRSPSRRPHPARSAADEKGLTIALQTDTTGKTLMIVEDEALVAMELRDTLEEAGYHVLDLTARRAEALEVARACEPDLALVNIRLAGRDDGIELAENLKPLGIPVVFISGQSSRARSAETAAIASMPKPYASADMVMAVAYLLASLEGDNSLPKPSGLEIFDHSGFDVAPAA
jgi:two-component system, response regulator PdtaR